MYKVLAEIYVEADPGEQTEEEKGEAVASAMDTGLGHVLRQGGFPEGEIVGARVSGITVATAEESAPYREDG